MKTPLLCWTALMVLLSPVTGFGGEPETGGLPAHAQEAASLAGEGDGTESATDDTDKKPQADGQSGDVDVTLQQLRYREAMRKVDMMKRRAMAAGATTWGVNTLVWNAESAARRGDYAAAIGLAEQARRRYEARYQSAIIDRAARRRK